MKSSENERGVLFVGRIVGVQGAVDGMLSLGYCVHPAPRKEVDCWLILALLPTR